MKLEYELITNDNIDLATSIQHTIFETECAYFHYKHSIETNYKDHKYYIVVYNKIPIGITGLYMEGAENNSIWLGWFGVLKEFRSKGFGRQIILDTIEKAKNEGKKFFRLYTSDTDDATARPLYRSVMHEYEVYDNKDDFDYNGTCLVYSYSITGEKIEPWNNKYMGLNQCIDEEEQGNKLWESKYRILLLSNYKENEEIEDVYIATAFRKDGHIVDMKWVDYDEKLDDKYDIIIRKNTWVEDKEETKKYEKCNNIMVKRLLEKNKKTVNLIGLDGNGKEYLVELFKKGEKVIPSIDNIDDINKIDDICENDKYIVKEITSFGSGLGQREMTRDELVKGFNYEKDLIQPKLKFKSEVQCYFIGDKLMYTYEYTPSKYPDYPEPKLIDLTNEEKELACHFANVSDIKVGVKRIDFLRLLDDSLLLLKIEDNSPHMNMEKLDINMRNKVIEEYKNMIYNYIETK